MNIQMDYKPDCSKSDSITTNALKQCLSKLSTEITIIEVENESLRNNAKGGTQNFLKIFFSLKTHVIFAFYSTLHLCLL